MEIQIAIMEFFQKLASPALDVIANFCSLLGEAGLIIAIAVAILWCVDKRKGFAICSTLLTALVATNTIKAIVRAPRPFQVLPQVAGKRLSTATGYSFPSGHTTGASSFYTSLAMATGKRWFSIICALIILFVATSRMYLGVHWPIDVVGGLILGCTVSLCTYKAFGKLYDNDRASKLYSVIVGSVATAAGIVFVILLQWCNADPVAFTDLMKMCALAGGGYLGFALERKYVHYSVAGSTGKRVVRYLVGIIILLLIMGAKAILPPWVAFGFLRYWLAGFWATGLFPLLGTVIKVRGNSLFEREQA